MFLFAILTATRLSSLGWRSACFRHVVVLKHNEGLPELARKTLSSDAVGSLKLRLRRGLLLLDCFNKAVAVVAAVALASNV